MKVNYLGLQLYHGQGLGIYDVLLEESVQCVYYAHGLLSMGWPGSPCNNKGWSLVHFSCNM